MSAKECEPVKKKEETRQLPEDELGKSDLCYCSLLLIYIALTTTIISIMALFASVSQLTGIRDVVLQSVYVSKLSKFLLVNGN